jgi:hypothetical protein
VKQADVDSRIMAHIGERETTAALLREAFEGVQKAYGKKPDKDLLALIVVSKDGADLYPVYLHTEHGLLSGAILQLWLESQWATFALWRAIHFHDAVVGQA